MAPPGVTRTVVVDATVVIHLAKAGRLDLLGSLQGWDFVVPDQDGEEVSCPDQAQALARALDIRRAQFEPPNWRIAETAGFLGETLARLGRTDEGVALMRESVDAFTALYGPANPRTEDARRRLERWAR